MSQSSFGRTLRWAGVFLLAAILAGTGRAQTEQEVPANTNPPSTRKPCIILIVANDLGFGDLGCYGQTKIKTPNIDKLAAEGMRFTSFYAGGTASAPSRAALLTGKDTGHSRIRGSNDILSLQSEETIAEILERSRYRTAAFGKWELGSLGNSVPTRKGFGEWFGFLADRDAQNDYPEFMNRARNKAESGEVIEQAKQQPITENANGKRGKYANDYFTEVALNFVSFSKPEVYNNYRPFFLYLPYTFPRANMAPVGQDGGEYAGERWSQAEKNRAAAITLLDSYVGKFLDKLKQQTNDLNTIIIFTSANSAGREPGVDPKTFSSTGQLRGAKGDVYEGGLRVPFIVRWPLMTQAGSVCDVPLASWDFLPTAAELGQQKLQKGTGGISFVPALLGEKQTNRHDFLYWEGHEPSFKQAVRMGDWKAVQLSAGGPFELYNLKDDPGEKDNVADKNPDVTAKVLEHLKKARTDDPNWPVKKAAPPQGR